MGLEDLITQEFGPNAGKLCPNCGRKTMLYATMMNVTEATEVGDTTERLKGTIGQSYLRCLACDYAMMEVEPET